MGGGPSVGDFRTKLDELKKSTAMSIIPKDSQYPDGAGDGMEVDEIGGERLPRGGRGLAPLRIKQSQPPNQFRIPAQLQEQVDKALDEKMSIIKYEV